MNIGRVSRRRLAVGEGEEERRVRLVVCDGGDGVDALRMFLETLWC
jgi:hypothetical protein